MNTELHLKALTQAVGVEPSKNPPFSIVPSSASPVLRLGHCRYAPLALPLVVVQMGRLLPVRFARSGPGSRPSYFGRLRLLGRVLRVRFAEHSRIRIACLRV